MNGWQCSVIAVGLALAGGTAAAQGKELPRVAVTCVDAEGKPVPDAEVHLFQHRKSASGPPEYVASGPHRTDANGVAVTAIALDYDGGRFDRWFHARVPGRLVGALRWVRFDDTPPAEPVIRMAKSREVRGRVRVPDGASAATVRVRTLSGYLLGDDGQFEAPLPRVTNLGNLREVLPALFDAEVAPDGSFVLRDLPIRALLYLAAEGPGFAQAQWFNAMLPERRIPDVVEMTMEREAVVAGTVVDPAGRALADARVEVTIDSSPGHGVQYPFAARTDAAGSFRIGGLPAGEFKLVVAHPPAVMRPAQVTLAAAEQKSDVRVALEAGVEVRGIVRRLPERVGVERVGVCAILDDEYHMWPLAGGTTDAQGRFTLRLPEGPARLYIGGVPRGYQQPSSEFTRLMRIDVRPDDRSLTEIVFELDPAK